MVNLLNSVLAERVAFRHTNPRTGSSVANLAKHTRRLRDLVLKASEQLQKLKGQFYRATGYKGDPSRVEPLAQKINAACHAASLAAQTALIHAEGARNVAGREGVPEGLLAASDLAIDSVKKAVAEGLRLRQVEANGSDNFLVSQKVEHLHILANAMLVLYAATSNLVRE